ncbi:MAG TPA: hypothetical protein PLV68_21210, partial [Ilumatobacteraceae bacterium]|nr:hypothetical protein [Ilumatobacteraceae bacterium]
RYGGSWADFNLFSYDVVLGICSQLVGWTPAIGAVLGLLRGGRVGSMVALGAAAPVTLFLLMPDDYYSGFGGLVYTYAHPLTSIGLV